MFLFTGESTGPQIDSYFIAARFFGSGFISIILSFPFVILGVYFKNREKNKEKNTGQNTEETGGQKTSEELIYILKSRYAKGEINKEEYEQMKKDIED